MRRRIDELTSGDRFTDVLSDTHLYPGGPVISMHTRAWTYVGPTGDACGTHWARRTDGGQPERDRFHSSVAVLLS